MSSTDPVYFFARTLGWKPWHRQIEIARAVHAAIEGRGPRRIAVRSGNGVGKTAIAARVMLWALRTYYDSVVITTAPTTRQVEHILWREARKAFHAAREKLEGTLYDGQPRWDLPDGRFALGMSPDKVHPERFQGFHAQLLLFIIDEASGISEAYWEAIKGNTLAGNAIILAIGNPTRNLGEFYDAFHRSRHLYHGIHISALDLPNLFPPHSPIPPVLLPLLPVRAPLSSLPHSDAEALALTYSSRGQDGVSPVAAPESLPSPSEGLPSPPSLRGKEPGLAGSAEVESSKPRGTPVGATSRPLPAGDETLALADASASPTTNPHPNDDTSDPPAGTPADATGCYPAALINREAVLRALDDWGLESPLFQVRILGNFATLAEHSLISLDWVECAAQYEESLSSQHSPLPGESRREVSAYYIGVDVARFGGDETAIVILYGSPPPRDSSTPPLPTRLVHLEAHHGWDTMRTAARLKELYDDLTMGRGIGPIASLPPDEVLANQRHREALDRALHARPTLGYDWEDIRNETSRLLAVQPNCSVTIAVDDAPVGGGVIDRLRMLNVPTKSINFGAEPVSAKPERFYRRGSELYWNLKEALREGLLALPRDEKLFAQLTQLNLTLQLCMR